MAIFSFPSISNAKSKVVILGTMPGNRSLALNQYYGHRGNQFWPILFSILGKKISHDYEVKKRLALDNCIAVWDVLQACERESSADSDIQKEVPNDFDTFFNEHSINCIFFNGKNPKTYFDFYVKDPGIPQVVLPSTSPANTWFTKAEKERAFRQILDHL